MDRTYESHIPPNLPCPDPEGCKHFKEQIALEDENARLKALLENSKTQLEYDELKAEIDKLREALDKARGLYSYCHIHDTYPLEGEPCYQCCNKAIEENRKNPFQENDNG